MHRAVARQSLQAQRDFHHLAYPGILARSIRKAGLHLEGLRQTDVELIWHHLGDALDIGEAHIQHAPDVFQRRACAQRVEGDDLSNLLAPVFLRDVLNHFAAPVHAEIDIDIRHADALRIQEALEQQPVLQRIDVSDLHRVADQAARCRPASRAHRNPARFGEANEIPHDQKITRELHLLDHADFRIQPLRIRRQGLLQLAGAFQRFQARSPLFKSLSRDEFKVRIRRMLRRHIESRKRRTDFFQLHLAALGDFPRPVDGVFQLAEQRHHLGARFQIEIWIVPVHTRRVAHGLPGLNAHQNFVGARVVAMQVMRVVGSHQRNAGFLRQPVHLRGDQLVLIQAMILNFQKEIALAENILIRVRQAAGFVVAIGHQRFVDVAAQAGRERDDPSGMLRQQIFIDARLVIEALQKASGNQLNQVAIALLVFAEQHQMVVAIRIRARLVALLRDVNLAADDRMHALGLGGFVKLHRAE